MISSSKVLAKQLRDVAYRFAYMQDGEEYSHIDKFKEVTTWISDTCRELIRHTGATFEEEAEICLSVLVGYSTSIPDSNIIQNVLDRSYQVLTHLTPSFLKCQLLTYCYGEVYDDELASEAKQIMNSWTGRKLTQEEKRLKELLSDMERNAKYWEEG